MIGKYYTNCGVMLLSYVILWMVESIFGRTLNLDLGSGINGTEFDLTSVQSRSIQLMIYIQTPFPEGPIDHSLTVLAPEDHRLLGFVNMAHLRVAWTTTNDTSLEWDEGLDYVPECVDHITVESPNGAEMICHDVSHENTLLHPPGLIGPRSFRGIGGQLELRIHTGAFLGASQNATMRQLAELSFTAYAECPEEEDATDWTRCSADDDFSCIRSFLICDNHTHCLFPESFGKDEKGCDKFEENVASDIAFSAEKSSNSTNNRSSEGQDTKWGNRRHGHTSTRNKQSSKEKVKKERDEVDDGESGSIRSYFLPTAAIFFLIWGVVSVLRKCYRCYRSEYGKEEFYN